MGKVSKKKSRRDNRGSRRSNNDLEQSARKPTGESSSMILTEMTSMDLKKRLSAIIMYKDLLMQNLNNLTVITKLTTVEILSSLSLRLIDSVSGVRSEAVKCFLAVARCGTKFAEKIFDLGIHETIRKMLEELSASTSSSDDTIVDDLLCIVHLLSSYYPPTYSSSSSGLLSLAMSNLAPHVLDSRRISFAEYLVNSSTNYALVKSEERVWSGLYIDISNFIADKYLSEEPESIQNYLLVLLCSIMSNLLCLLPQPTLLHSKQVISFILKTLTDSLYIEQKMQPPPSTVSCCSNDMTVDGAIIEIKSDKTATQTGYDSSLHIGKYKTLCLKTSAEALCRLFTETERRTDLDCREVEKGSKRKMAAETVETIDFKKEYNVEYNAFYSICLGSSALLARRTTKIKSEGEGEGERIIGGTSDGSTSVVSGDAQCSTSTSSSTALESQSSVGDVLESFLTALCTSTDFAALSLLESSVSDHIERLSEILDVLYSSLCVSLAPSVGSDADAGDSDGETEDTERLRFLTTSVCACLSSLLQHATPSAFIPLVSSADAAEKGVMVMQRLALVLCRCITSTDSDISMPCIGSMGSLGAKNDQIEAMGLKEVTFLSSKINWLFSNAILRTLDNIVIKGCRAEQNIYLLEICLSAFVDLHSSDDPLLLQNFIKLKSIEKLGSAVRVFEAAVRDFSEASTRDKAEDYQTTITDFQDTVLNTHSFLEYKANYCK